MRLTFLLSTVLAVSTTNAYCAPADFVGSSSSLSIDRTTAVPGDVLKEGSYSISVTEQLADRMIVRIDSTTSKNHAIFLGIPSSTAKLGGGSGAVPWGVGLKKTPTMRGFVFPNGNTVEFVYPKPDAAALAKDNEAVVAAVDPRSEGKVALKSLSQDELQIVNLWLLSMTTTGVDGQTPAVLARRYQGPENVSEPVVAKSVAPTYQPTPQANIAPPPPVERTAIVPAPGLLRNLKAKTRTERVGNDVAAKAERRAEPAPSSSPQVASLEEPAIVKTATRPTHHPAVAELPHTGSSMPIFWMLEITGLVGAGLARMLRFCVTRRLEAHELV